MAGIAAYLNADMFHSGGDSVALDVGSLSSHTSWDFGPRLYHESGTGCSNDLTN